MDVIAEKRFEVLRALVLSDRAEKEASDYVVLWHLLRDLIAVCGQRGIDFDALLRDVREDL